MSGQCVDGGTDNNITPAMSTDPPSVLLGREQQIGDLDADVKQSKGNCHNGSSNVVTGIPRAAAVVMCLLALVEGMDIVLIGVSQQAFFVDIKGWDMFQAGWLGMAQGIFQNAGAVFWGVAADRGYMKRKNILCFAAALQGLCTFSLTFVSTIPPMWPIRMANGFFLAALRPISNGIVADLASTKDQGFYFGLMQGLWALGLSGTGMIVGPLAEGYYDLPILGETRGWRIAYVVVSSFAIVASLAALPAMPDVPPPELTTEEKQQSPLAVAIQEIQTMLKFLKYPSFGLMITQGIFGSIPWLVIGNLNLYARLCGFEMWTLFWLSAPGLFGVLGGFLGGIVSDYLAKKIGPRGRPLTAMLTVAMGVPLQFIMWYGIAPGSALNNVWVFFVIQAVFNVVANWAQPGCNFPVLGQIVTGKDRNKVMCWEMAFENTMATIIGSNAVPYVIKAFGSNKITYDGHQDLEQARTLGYAQAIMICCPWLICFAVYSLLLWSFPIDVDRVEREITLAKSKETELESTI